MKCWKSEFDSIISFFEHPEIQNMKTEKGLALEDILREVHLFVMRSKSNTMRKLTFLLLNFILIE